MTDDKMTANRQSTLVLQTDMAAFDTELREYVTLWPVYAASPARLSVVDWKTGFDSHTVDRGGNRAAPSERRAYAITMQTPHPDRPVIPIRLDVTTIWVARINRDRIRITVGAPVFDEARPFVADFIKHCEDLWEGTLIQTKEPPSVVSPPPPDKQASAEEHALWLHRYGSTLAISLEKYADEYMNRSAKTLYNARSALGIAKRRKSGNRGKKVGK